MKMLLNEGDRDANEERPTQSDETKNGSALE